MVHRASTSAVSAPSQACSPQGTARGRRIVRAYLGCALGLASLVSASSPGDARTISFYSIGLGRKTCQEYLEASKGLDPSHFRSLFKEQRKFASENESYDEWLNGAVSAMNYASGESGRHPDVRLGAADLVTWVRTWCGTHPNETVMTAVLSLLQEKWAAGATTTQAGPPTMPAPQMVFVIFQDDISTEDKDAFLQAYKASIVGGQNGDQSYRLRLGEQVPQDQMQLVLDSMKSQKKLIKTAFAK